MKIGVVAFTTTLMLAGASHAAEKIALICSDAKGKDDYSLSIDLDRKLASFHMSDLPDADDVPVTRVMLSKRRGKMKTRRQRGGNKTFENKMCAGGVHLFITAERDLGFGCIEGNRRFLF